MLFHETRDLRSRSEDVIKMVVDQQVDGEVHKVAVEVTKLSHLLKLSKLIYIIYTIYVFTKSI